MVLMISMMDLGVVMFGAHGINQVSADMVLVYDMAPIWGFNAARKGRGKDIESHDMLRQGFTHVFLMAFNRRDEFNAFQTHPNDLEFTGVFSPAIEKIVVLDFPSNLVKAPACSSTYSSK
ncbi:hypothetical protein JHK87_047503 [Glycine soja]|nr:hypothetical protein JHK87_047503 [Glycine soja]